MTLDFLNMHNQTLRLQISKLNMGTLLWLSGQCSWFLLFLLVYMTSEILLLFLTNGTAPQGLCTSVCPWSELREQTLWPGLTFCFPNILWDGCLCTLSKNLCDDFHSQRKGSMRTRYIQRSWLIKLEALIRSCLSFICRHIFHLLRKNDFLEKMIVRNDVLTEWSFPFKSWVWPGKQRNSAEYLSFQVNFLLLSTPTVIGLSSKYTQSTS